MPAPISDEKRERIIELLGEGHTCSAIAAEVAVSTSTVSNVAKSVGHVFGQSNLVRAHEARSSYAAERRAAIAARLAEEADQLLDELHGEFLVFSFGGRDNEYNEHTLGEPPVDAKRAIVQTVRDAMRTVIDIDRHDNRNDEGLAAVDAWLRDIVGEAAS